MSVLSEKTEEKLNKLKTDYIKKLPSRFNEIKRAAADALAAPSDKSKLQDLRLLLHKIAGSGATFDIDSLTETSRRFETYVQELLEKTEPIEKDTGARIRTFLLELREICASGTGSGKTGDSGNKDDGFCLEHPTERKVVFVLGENDDIAHDLSEQLGYFGYEVEVINNFNALKTHMTRACNELLIINADLIENDEHKAEEIRLLKEGRDRNLGIVYFSDRDSFDTRLGCIRAGGDDFFPLPLDLTRLIDRVDQLTCDDSEHPYHILIVDDDPEQVSYYALMLQQSGMITSVASDPRKVLNILSESKPDLILMDMYMPGCDGTELASLIRQQEAFVSIPIVFLSYEADKDIQLKAIQKGGDDFLTKPIKPAHLISSVLSRAERTRNLRYFMERDSLTGLLNHTNIKELLANEVLRAERINAGLCFAMLDIDHFKKVNDTHGHMTGDRVLKSLSRLLQDRLRRTDIIGRYGGEEFAVILLNTDIENAVRIMDEIRQNFSQIRHYSEEGDFYVTFSCGIAAFPGISSAVELNSYADQALYRSKETGRNKITAVSGPAE